MIAPTLGIGDILTLKMYSVSKKVTYPHINICYELLKINRLRPEENIKFLKHLIKKLFPETTISVVQNATLYHRPFNFDITYIYDYYKFDNIFENEYGDYIIFHTKVRFTPELSHYFNKEKHFLQDFFSKFKTKYNILILGERFVEQNREAIGCNIITIYPELMKLAKNNNVFDLTYETLYSSNEIINFEKDMFLINNAKTNVTFGEGGPLVICQAFSKSNICYIGALQSACLNIFSQVNGNLYNSLEIFVKKLNEYADN